MPGSPILNTVRVERERAGLSQQALASQTGTTRQALIAIETGRRTPSTHLALRLARALACDVDDLFRLANPDTLDATLVGTPDGAPLQSSGRVALARIGERWIAHTLTTADPPVAADGVIDGQSTAPVCKVQPLSDLATLECNALVAGCAPLLGSLAPRIGLRYRDARGTWLPANSERALEMLARDEVHAAGIHLFDEGSGDHNVPLVRARFSDRRMIVVNLTRWTQGLLLAPGNPLGIRGVEDLTTGRKIRLARREDGSGAAKLVHRLLGAGSTGLPAGPTASGHEDVARLVRYGAADVGIAIEGVALSSGLAFVPLAEERFDLVIPDSRIETTPVRRLLDTLQGPAFRTEVETMPGYDASMSGHVTTVEATT